SALLKREITISAALLSASGFVALIFAGVPPLWAGVAGAVAGFGLRAGAIHYGWALPAFGDQRDKGKA
ncbi:MAG: trimeric intracellular cation channel family protein, partial [Terricaulis sp.]